MHTDWTKVDTKRHELKKHLTSYLGIIKYRPLHTLETSRVDAMAEANAGKQVRETKKTEPAPKLSNQICKMKNKSVVKTMIRIQEFN